MIEQWIREGDDYQGYLDALLQLARNPAGNVVLSYWLRNVIMQEVSAEPGLCQQQVGAQNFVRRVYSDLNIARAQHAPASGVAYGGSEWDRSRDGG